MTTQPHSGYSVTPNSIAQTSLTQSTIASASANRPRLKNSCATRNDRHTWTSDSAPTNESAGFAVSSSKPSNHPFANPCLVKCRSRIIRCRRSNGRSFRLPSLQIRFACWPRAMRCLAAQSPFATTFHTAVPMVRFAVTARLSPIAQRLFEMSQPSDRPKGGGPFVGLTPVPVSSITSMNHGHGSL